MEYLIKKIINFWKANLQRQMLANGHVSLMFAYPKCIYFKKIILEFFVSSCSILMTLFRPVYSSFLSCCSWCF